MLEMFFGERVEVAGYLIVLLGTDVNRGYLCAGGTSLRSRA